MDEMPRSRLSSYHSSLLPYWMEFHEIERDPVYNEALHRILKKEL